MLLTEILKRKFNLYNGFLVVFIRIIIIIMTKNTKDRDIKREKIKRLGSFLNFFNINVHLFSSSTNCVFSSFQMNLKYSFILNLKSVLMLFFFHHFLMIFKPFLHKKTHISMNFSSSLAKEIPQHYLYK